MAKTLRVAALIRVSTEKQEEKGESLRKQRTDITAATKQLSGTIVEWYGGQEHATPGAERKEVQRLLKDAQKKNCPFDTVMVHHADRWSRDNVASSTGLDLLLNSGIQYFYVLTDRHDLYDPNDRLRLAFHALIGQYVATNQTKKSIEARIHRAKRGIPTGGKIPFGRRFDRETGKWSVDPTKQKMMKDAARRYLKNGESISAIAEEYGLNHSAFHKNLMTRCGDKWEMEFKIEKLNIYEKVTISIPPLLDEATIKALHKKAVANKTYSHGALVNRYLLSRMIFCQHCGYAMFGQTNHGNRRYYRHAHHQRSRPCPASKGWVQADVIESNVIRQLLEMFGDQKALERAMEAAVPDLEKVSGLAESRERLLEKLEKNKRQRARTMSLMHEETLPEGEGREALLKIKESDTKLQEKLAAVDSQLDGTITSATRREVADTVAQAFKKLSPARRRAILKAPVNEVTWEDRRGLAQSVFGGTLPDGRRMGVYITWDDDAPKTADHVATGRGKPWRYSVIGHLVNENGLLPFTDDFLDAREGLTKRSSH